MPIPKSSETGKRDGAAGGTQNISGCGSSECTASALHTTKDKASDKTKHIIGHRAKHQHTRAVGLREKKAAAPRRKNITPPGEREPPPTQPNRSGRKRGKKERQACRQRCARHQGLQQLGSCSISLHTTKGNTSKQQIKTNTHLPTSKAPIYPLSSGAHTKRRPPKV